MKFKNLLKAPEQEFIFNSFGIESHSKESASGFRFWYQHIRDSAKKEDGDVFEFGVYKGATLLSAAILLKKLNSNKTVYGFDSYTGFPSYSEYDELNCFEKYLNLDSKSCFPFDLKICTYASLS